MILSRTLFRQLISLIRYPKLFFYSKRIGWNIRLGSNGRVINPGEVSFGDNIYIAPNFHISARNLEIANNVLIGPNLLLECDDHIFRNVGHTIWSKRQERDVGFVKIEDDVWIGGNVTILKNVKIGEGCIIGAASVVTKSLPPYSICVGSPCYPIKVRFNSEELSRHLTLVNSSYNLNTILDLWKICGLV
jgi:acetyltransferase-like isoleucine patch superfamily enzyme